MTATMTLLLFFLPQTAWVVPLSSDSFVSIHNQIGLPLSTRMLRCRSDCTPDAMIREKGVDTLEVVGDAEEEGQGNSSSSSSSSSANGTRRSGLVIPHEPSHPTNVKVSFSSEEDKASSITWIELVVNVQPADKGRQQQGGEKQPTSPDFRVAIVGLSRAPPPSAKTKSRLRRIGASKDGCVRIRGNRVAVLSDKVYRSHICGETRGKKRQAGAGQGRSCPGFVVNAEVAPVDVCAKYPDVLVALSRQLGHMYSMLPPKVGLVVLLLLWPGCVYQRTSLFLKKYICIAFRLAGCPLLVPEHAGFREPFFFLQIPLRDSQVR